MYTKSFSSCFGRFLGLWKWKVMWPERRADTSKLLIFVLGMLEERLKLLASHQQFNYLEQLYSHCTSRSQTPKKYQARGRVEWVSNSDTLAAPDLSAIRCWVLHGKGDMCQILSPSCMCVSLAIRLSPFYFLSHTHTHTLHPPHPTYSHLMPWWQ